MEQSPACYQLPGCTHTSAWSPKQHICTTCLLHEAAHFGHELRRHPRRCSALQQPASDEQATHALACTLACSPHNQPVSSCPQPASQPPPSRASSLLVGDGGGHQISASLRHQLCDRQAHMASESDTFGMLCALSLGILTCGRDSGDGWSQHPAPIQGAGLHGGPHLPTPPAALTNHDRPQPHLPPLRPSSCRAQWSAPHTLLLA